MPIRARNRLRPDAACASADVLTTVERHVERAQRRSSRPVVAVMPVAIRRTGVCWGDIPAIRQVLLALL